jgi:hypothetical protein
VEIDGRRYHYARGFKHDFFAATGLYEGPHGRIVLKIGRRVPFFGVPMTWVGRYLARREADMFHRLADLDVVPRFTGMWGKGAMAHEYVPGHVLRKGERVPDDFFGRLQDAVAEMHARDMAYVDLEKCENVLVGDDGRPYLFDFQIAFRVPPSWRWFPPARWLLRRFQQGDRYHLTKLQRRTRPDQLRPEVLAASYRRPFYVHVHRWLTRPFQAARRWVLRRVDPVRASGERVERGRIDGS